MKILKSKYTLFIAIALGAGMLLGVAVAALGAGGLNLTGWLAASALSFVSIFLMLLAWDWAGRLKIVGILMIVAFLIRLIVGIALSLGIPTWGFNNPRELAGYYSTDSFRRDTDAWDLAKSDKNILVAFGGEYSTDQYGGLLSLSAMVYRYLSPDVHRPFLIIILTALASAIGIPFLWKTIQPRWGKRPALVAGWLLALYPDVILSGASQMREAFLINLIAIGFWAVNQWKQTRWKAATVFTLSMLGLFIFSWRTALAALAALVVWFLVDNLMRNWSTSLQTIVWIFLIVVFAGVAVLSFAWFQNATIWDSHLTIINSGWVQMIVQDLGLWSRVPFVTLYGLATPVLPAAFADVTKPVWMIINILRSLGWYALAPLLIYSIIAILKMKTKEERRPLVWVSIFCVLWLLLSSLRAGGDQWDNPRYRTIFLPWLGLLAGIAIDQAIKLKDAWLSRWLIVEGIFLVLFMDWYSVRYFNFGIPINFYWMVGLIVLLSAGVLIGGALWDRKKMEKRLNR